MGDGHGRCPLGRWRGFGLGGFPSVVKEGHAGRHGGRGTRTVRWGQVGVGSLPAWDRRCTDSVAANV